jgi:SAM-dependent methyltransferase
LLSHFCRIHAIELDDEVREHANNRQICNVKKGYLPNNVPIEEMLDVICMFDVLEHISDDLGALETIGKKLKNDGKIILTVPAFKFLWSAHDIANHHVRRYSHNELIRLVKEAGYKITYSTYFNTFLFPIIAGIRVLNKFINKEEKTDIKMPSPILNSLLTSVFSSERFFIPKQNFPFGVSILLVGEIQN